METSTQKSIGKLGYYDQRPKVIIRQHLIIKHNTGINMIAS